MLQRDLLVSGCGSRTSFLNYRNIAGPEANLAWCCAFPREALACHTPEQLRLGIRDGSIVAEQIDNAGTPPFLDAIDIRDTVRQRRDMFSRPGFVWEVVGIDDLPAHVRSARQRYRHLIVNGDGLTTKSGMVGGGWRSLVNWWFRQRVLSRTPNEQPDL